MEILTFVYYYFLSYLNQVAIALIRPKYFDNGVIKSPFELLTGRNNLLVTVIVVLVVAAQCSQAADADGIGIKYLRTSIHPDLQRLYAAPMAN